MATQLEILIENINLLEESGGSEQDVRGLISDFGYTPRRFERALTMMEKSGGKITPSSAASNLIRGLTLGASDAIEAGARSLVGPESYEQERAAIRLGEQEYAEDYPGKKIAQELIGSVPTGIAASMLVPGSGPAVAGSRLGNFAKVAPVAAGEGAVAGYFGGDADPLSVDALQDAAIGAGAGLAFAGAGEFIGGLKDATTPALMNSAQERIVGQVLNRQATNPEQAAQTLAGGGEQLVPGSVPTTAQVAKDPGLAAAETTVRGMDTSNRLGQRILDQQTARADEMQRLAGSQDDLDRLKDYRNLQTAGMREAAFDEGGMITNPQDLIDSFNALANRPGIKGKRSVRELIQKFKKEVELLATDPDDPEVLLPIDPRDMYAVRQEMSDMLYGKLGNDDKAVARLSRQQIGELQSIIDDEIEAVAPGFQDYLATYTAKSKPVNRMETLQDIQRRAQSSSTNLQTGDLVLTGPKFRNALNARKKEIARLPLSNKKRINAIMRDLDRSSSATAPGIKAPGSDTFKNMSMASAIGTVFGEGRADSSLPKVISTSFQPLYAMTGSDDKLTEMLVQAMMDPELSARLMSRATEQNADNLMKAIRRRLPTFFYGTAAAQVGMNVD
jgi:hypothetical protein